MVVGPFAFIELKKNCLTSLSFFSLGGMGQYGWYDSKIVLQPRVKKSQKSIKFTLKISFSKFNKRAKN